MELDAILRDAVGHGASDVHLRVRQPPVLRVEGRLRRLETWPRLEAAHLTELAQTVVGPSRWARFESQGGIDVAYAVAGLARFRVSVCRACGELVVVLRAVPGEPPSLAALHLPPVVAKLALEPRGLILVTGPAGAGKTTTLAAMLAHVNAHRDAHVVTIEDPIEYEFEDRRCTFTQRELGGDTPTFAAALRLCLRQDPDIVMVGEMRDVDTMGAVLNLAETGHLVLSTVHTLTAAETVNRIISLFPPTHSRQIREQLAQTLRGVVSQRLLDRADGPGRVPAVEVLVGTLTVQRCIEDPTRTAELPRIMADGHDLYGMQTFNQSVLDFHQRGVITYEEARRGADSPVDLDVEVQRQAMAADVASRPPTGASAGRPSRR